MNIEARIRKAGQVAINHLIDTTRISEAGPDDMADYLTRIVDACVSAALAPQVKETAEPDYCFDPADWQFTCEWVDRDSVHGYGESLKPGQPMRVCTLLKGPDKWVADVPVTWDEDGDPD